MKFKAVCDRGSFEFGNASEFAQNAAAYPEMQFNIELMSARPFVGDVFKLMNIDSTNVDAFMHKVGRLRRRDLRQLKRLLKRGHVIDLHGDVLEDAIDIFEENL